MSLDQKQQAIFHAIPAPCLLIEPIPDGNEGEYRFLILDTNDLFSQVTRIEKKDILGQDILKALSNDKNTYIEIGAGLKYSLEQVISCGKNHKLEGIQYETRIYSIENIPVKNESGEVEYILFVLKREFPAGTHSVSDQKFMVNLLQQNEQYKSLFTHNPYGICSFDLKGNFITANESLAAIADLTLEELYQYNFDPFVKEEDLERVYGYFEEATKGKIQHFECGIISAKGREKTINVTNIPIILNNEIAGVYAIMMDITAQRNAEEKLIELNQQLTQKAVDVESVNAELEQFAYVASHDLREPLRMVSSFLDLLQRKYGSRLDDTAITYINYAVEGSKRMQQLIKDLLQYSRTGKEDGQKEIIDLNNILEEVMLNLYQQVEENKAKFEIESTLPQIRGFRTDIIRLFQNLISNAIKFRRKNTEPLIKIKATEKKNHWVFSISDNGLGMSEANYHKIFDIFSRLHSKDDYPGTGIGLAVCKKIVQQHNGEIGVTSVPGEGSTFSFTIEK